MWADTLKRAETEYNHEAFQAPQGEQWAAPLLRKIEQNGGILSAPMPLLLEIRIAYAFQQNGIEPQYEFAASSRTKSVDFHVHGSPEWLIEVVSLRTPLCGTDCSPLSFSARYPPIRSRARRAK